MGEAGNAARRSFGELLRHHRRTAGLSQEALAQRADLSVDAIAGLERGRRSAPHAETLGRLSHALALSGAERERFVRAADPTAQPDAPAPAVPRNNLPIPLSSFVGRVEAATALRRLLGASPPGTRLLTLVGPGGIGKTRLALEVARALADEPAAAAFADGIWLADLSALDDPAAVPAAVAASVDLGTVPSPSKTIAALVQTLAERRLLLVLDNCEHLIDACARLADALLRSCPNVSILATSREALAIPGEVVWPVAALRVADAGHVLGSEAGQLFAERASAVRPDFSLTPDNAGAVAELCRQLDGIPLAIELAAARIGAFDVQTLVARLADRFALLRSGNRVAPPRHQTLEALVQWSYDLLSPPEQRLFARLAVFAGGWDIEAVEAVAADAAPAGPATIELLGRLVDKSLVVRSVDRAGGARYSLLETLRQFAGRLLGAADEWPRLRERHARHYLAVLEGREPSIEGPHQAQQLQRLEQDIDNLRAALDWCAAADEAEPALRGAWCLAVLAWLRGYLEEVDGHLSTLLALPSGVAAAADVRAKALVAAGYVCFYRGQLERAHQQVGQGLQLFRGLHRARETGQALVWFGLIVDAHADLEQARRCFLEALHIFRDLGDTFWTARAATNLGRCLARQDDLAGAIPLLQEALALRRQLGDRRGVANTLHHLADALEGSGELGQARALADEALSIAQAVGDRFVTVRALIGLGRVAYALDEFRLADANLAQAMAVARRDGFGHEVAEVAVLQGLVARDTGDRVRAMLLAEEAVRIARQHGRWLEAARGLWLLGSLARQDDRLAEAAAYLRRSLALYQQVPDQTGIALASAGLAALGEREEHVAGPVGAAETVLAARARVWTIERHELERTLGTVGG